MCVGERARVEISALVLFSAKTQFVAVIKELTSNVFGDAVVSLKVSISVEHSSIQ